MELTATSNGGLLRVDTEDEKYIYTVHKYLYNLATRQ